MVSKKIERALNDQLNAEFYSWYTYLAMSSYFIGLGLNGFGSWMRQQAQREMHHAMKIYDFLHERTANVYLQQVGRPGARWQTPLEAVREAYEHEQQASSRINDLVDLSSEERAHATYQFLQWFVTEQVQEEARLRAIVEKLKLVGQDRYGLFLIDRDIK